MPIATTPPPGFIASLRADVSSRKNSTRAGALETIAHADAQTTLAAVEAATTSEEHTAALETLDAQLDQLERQALTGDGLLADRMLAAFAQAIAQEELL